MEVLKLFKGKSWGKIKNQNLLSPVDLDFKKEIRDLPGGTEKNPPAKAGDTGSIPGLGRFHMPRSNLSPCATTTEAKDRNH